jgi:bifunctional NMN adenylyltransferase/nudix hydrolase
MNRLKTIEESAEVGVIVARFQVPELHEEHKALIQRVVTTHPRVIVILGLAADACKCTFNNPLDFPTRKAMLEQEFPSIEVLYIKDVGNNEIWSRDLDRIIHTQIGPSQKVVLYGGRDSFVPHYKGTFPAIELVPNRIISGKEIRRNVGVKCKNTKEFREGVIWAVENQWPGALPTVDVAIIDKKTESVLLIRKSNKTQYQFVGGFASPNAENYEEDAAREVQEETNLECKDYSYIGSAKINDWRFRSEKNKIKTIFFAAEYVSGTPQVNDKIENIAELRWVPLKELKEEMFIEEHTVLFRLLTERVTINA